MKLFDTNLVNTALNIDSSLFSNEEYNPDIMNAKAIKYYYDSNYNQALDSISQACKLVDRFHSYFHFEQSYVYTQIAEIFFIYLQFDKSVEYLDKAIFQDHLNFQAINRMINSCYKLGKTDNYKYWLERAEKLCITDVSCLYKPEYQQFIEYVIFATGDKTLDNNHMLVSSYEVNTHYHTNRIASEYFSNTDYKIALEYYNKSAEILEKSHASYHQNSAKIYLNRSFIYKTINQIELAKNDFNKASDLDPNFVKKLSICI